MTSEFDKLQELAMAEMKEIYSKATIDHAMNPRNIGSLADSNGFAGITGPCGDTMEIWLKVENGIVTSATFVTDGCGTSIASGSIATELAKGKSIPGLLKTNQQDILNGLGGLPEGNAHCALLAANTLKEAARNYIVFKNEPWKKTYHKY